MNEAEQILVVILSSALAVFLILGIVVLVLIIQVLKSIKRLSFKAEVISDTVESSIKSLSLVRLLSSLVGLFNNNKRSRRR